MKEHGPFAFSCEVCGSIYTDRDLAGACEVFPAEAEEIPVGTLVRAREGGQGTGLGRVTASYLLGLEDPRGRRTSASTARASCGGAPTSAPRTSSRSALRPRPSGARRWNEVNSEQFTVNSSQ